MRTYVLALLVVAGLGVSACGSDDSSTDVVPSSVPALALPQGTDKLAASSSSGSSDQTASSSDQTSTNADQTTTQGQSPSSTSGSTTTGQTPQQQTQTGTGGTSTGSTGGTSSGGASSGGTSTSGNGTGGVQPDEFSQFCKDNPGAC